MVYIPDFQIIVTREKRQYLKAKQKEIAKHHLQTNHLNGQGPIPNTQHVHDQQMFLLLTNHKSKFLQRARK